MGLASTKNVPLQTEDDISPIETGTAHGFPEWKGTETTCQK